MMKNKPTYNKGSIVFIPDYLSKQLNSLGINAEQLTTIANIQKGVERNSVVNTMGNKLRESMSGNDIKDIINLNTLLYTHLFKLSVNQMPMSALLILIEICSIATDSYYAEPEETVAIANLYNNRKIDIETILMNGNNKNELYTCDVMTDTLIVIIHDGFTNFIVMNNKEVTNNLSTGLLDYYATRLGIDSFNKSFLLTI